MSKSLVFRVEDEIFSVLDLIDKHRDTEEVQRLIKILDTEANEYEAHGAMPEDIHTVNDKWSCHGSDIVGITYEFLDGIMIYIAFDKKYFHFEDAGETYTAVKTLHYQHEELDENFIVFLSKDSAKKGFLPNRFVPLIHLGEGNE